MTMNEDHRHDLERAKLKASLSWLISKAFCDNIPSVYSELFLEDAKGMWSLKPLLVRALTSGELYCAACTHLFPDNSAAWTDHALVLAQLWQRCRVRAVEPSGQMVTELALRKDQPFLPWAHIGLVDAIQRAAMEQQTSVPAIMESITRHCPGHPPPEPLSLDAGLQLWLRCVCEAVLDKRLSLRDPAQRQAKARALQQELRFPTRLACLLRFYLDGADSADLVSPLQDLTAIEAHVSLVIEYCRRLRESCAGLPPKQRPGALLFLDRRQLLAASVEADSVLRANLLCLLAELFAATTALHAASNGSDSNRRQSQDMPSFHMSTRINTRASSQSPARSNSSQGFRLRAAAGPSDSGSGSDDPGGDRKPRSRGNSLSRGSSLSGAPHDNQLGALFSRRPAAPGSPARCGAPPEASLEITSVRTGSPRPSGFSEPLLPAALRPSKEKSTPEVSKAIESGEQGQPAFRARSDASPLSSGTFRLPRGQARVAPPPDEEFQTPMEPEPAGDGRKTFAQFMAQQKAGEGKRKSLPGDSGDGVQSSSVPSLPDAGPRSLKEEFERKKKARAEPVVKRTTFAPLPNQTTWAAVTTEKEQLLRRKSETSSVDGDAVQAASERGSLTSHPSFTDTKIKIEQKKRHITAELKKADQKLRQMREKENKKIFEKLCMKKEAEEPEEKAEERKEKRKEERKELEEKKEPEEKDKAELEKEKRKDEERKEKRREQKADTNSEVSRLQTEVEAMRSEKESLKEMLLQIQRQQDLMQQQHQQEERQRRIRDQEERERRSKEEEEKRREREAEQQRRFQEQQEILFQQQQQLLQQHQQQKQQQLHDLQQKQQQLQELQNHQQQQPQNFPEPPDRSSGSPVPSEGALSVNSASQAEFGNIYDRFNQSLSDLQQDISKLSLQQEFMNKTIKERLHDGPTAGASAPNLSSSSSTSSGRAQAPPAVSVPVTGANPEPATWAAAAANLPPWMPPLAPFSMPPAGLPLHPHMYMYPPYNGQLPAAAATAATAANVAPMADVRAVSPAPPEVIAEAAAAPSHSIEPAPPPSPPPPPVRDPTPPPGKVTEASQRPEDEEEEEEEEEEAKEEEEEDEASPHAAFFVSFGEEKVPARPPKGSREAPKATAVPPRSPKLPKQQKQPVLAPAPDRVKREVSPVPPPAAFVLGDAAKAETPEEVARRRERFMAQQAKREKDRGRERIQKERMRELERRLRAEEREAVEARKAREREKRERVFQTYLERKAQEEEEERRGSAAQRQHRSSASSTGSQRAQRAPSHHAPSHHAPQPSAAPVQRNRSAGPAVTSRRAPASHHPPASSNGQTPPSLALDLPSDGSDTASPLYEYQGATTVRLSATTQHHQAPTHRAPSSLREREAVGAAPAGDYSGPKLFKQPKERSNRSVITNAISHCLLPGVVNREVRTNVLEELKGAEGSSFMILFRNRSCQYRGLYTFNVETEELSRFTGNGPKKVRNGDVVDFFKYDSGAKKFSLIDTTKHLSPVIDAFTIDQKLWKKSGIKPSGKVGPPVPSSGGGYASSRHH